MTKHTFKLSACTAYKATKNAVLPRDGTNAKQTDESMLWVLGDPTVSKQQVRQAGRLVSKRPGADFHAPGK